MVRHALPIKELDLRLQTSTVTERMNAVPGFRTSAAFFSFLRANLVLPPSTLNSTTSTPLLDPSSSQTLPPLCPSSLSTMTSNYEDDEPLPPPQNPLDTIPPLNTTIFTTEDDKITTLKLVADSIAQQRQFASRAVIFHPLTIAAYVLLLGVVSKLVYKTRADIGILCTTLAGVTMASLVGVRSLTGGYLALAEKFSWAFIKNDETGEEDIIIGSQFGEEIIGASILRLERNGGGGKKKKAGGKGLVRAWTVKLRYRGKGVGTELLEETVRVTRERLGNQAEIGFAVGHANSGMVLPEVFNGGFRKGEIRAARALEGVVEGTRKKR